MEKKNVLCVNFNQDNDLIAMGTKTGFNIYMINPLSNRDCRNLEGGIGKIEMLNATNLIIFVGSGDNAQFPVNKVIIWDEADNKTLGLLCFSGMVKNIKLTKKCIFVVCEEQVFVFRNEVFKNIGKYDSYINPKGIFAVAPNTKINVCAYPVESEGYIEIQKIVLEEDGSVCQNEKLPVKIKAHKSDIGFIALNFNGTRVATASVKGTLIRVFDTESGELLQELRRGSGEAVISSIVFSKDDKYLACASDKGTVHIFKVMPKNGNDKSSGNQKSFFGKIPLFGVEKEYFQSEWSFSQLRINSTAKKPICAFGEDNEIYVVTEDGMFYKGKFDPNSSKGSCTLLEEKALYTLTE
jgi:WD40 repeat protein